MKFHITNDINKKFYSLFTNPFVKWGIVPFCLLLLWFILTALQIFNVDKNFTVISYTIGKESYTKIPSGPLLKGDKIEGDFTAKDNYLGIIEMPLHAPQVNFDDEDKLVFRIREKGASSWYIQNTYRSGLFFGGTMFPFGFPQIANSRGKTYQFELESLKGDRQNAVDLDRNNLTLVSKYQYAKSQLLANKKVLISFLAIKIFNYLSTPTIIFPSIVFFLPLLFYFLWHLVFYKYFQNIDSLLIFSLLFILLDIIVLPLDFSLIYLILILLWIVTISKNKLDSSTSFFFALAFLILCPIFLLFKLQILAEKSALWVFIFMATGTIEGILEMKNTLHMKVSYEDIINEFLLLVRIQKRNE